MKRLALSVFLLIPTSLAADEVVLRGGGRLIGIVVERSATSVVIETGPGRITLPLARIERILPGTSPLETYGRRAGALPATDARGWLDLGLWARDQGLATQARAAFERVVALDPGNAVAQRAVGNVLLGERWVSPEESFRARGYVLFEGDWVQPAERDAIVAEQAARAEARVREAEARARTAEAEARRAEADARAAETPGIPLWGTLGPGFAPTPSVIAFCPICGNGHAPGSCPRRSASPPAPVPLPIVTTPTGRLGSSPRQRMRLQDAVSTCSSSLRECPN